VVRLGWVRPSDQEAGRNADPSKIFSYFLNTHRLQTDAASSDYFIAQK